MSNNCLSIANYTKILVKYKVVMTLCNIIVITMYFCQILKIILNKMGFYNNKNNEGFIENLNSYINKQAII